MLPRCPSLHSASAVVAVHTCPALLLLPLPYCPLQTGMLWNTEGGSPMVPVGEEDLPTPLAVSLKFCLRALHSAAACVF